MYILCNVCVVCVRCTVCLFFFCLPWILFCFAILLLDSYDSIPNIHIQIYTHTRAWVFDFRRFVFLVLVSLSLSFFPSVLVLSFAFIPLQFIWTCSNSIEFMRLRIYFLCTFFVLSTVSLLLLHFVWRCFFSLSLCILVKFNRWTEILGCLFRPLYRIITFLLLLFAGWWWWWCWWRWWRCCWSSYWCMRYLASIYNKCIATLTT